MSVLTTTAQPADQQPGDGSAHGAAGSSGQAVTVAQADKATAAACEASRRGGATPDLPHVRGERENAAAGSEHCGTREEDAAP